MYWFSKDSELARSKPKDCVNPDQYTHKVPVQLTIRTSVYPYSAKVIRTIIHLKSRSH